jgi:nitronate monooxygenase
MSSAGGFAFLAGGYNRPDALAVETAAAGQLSAQFGINLFAPGSFEPDREAFAATPSGSPPRRRSTSSSSTPTPHTDDDHWHDKLALLLDNPVPVVSVTFALPPAGDIARLRKVGSIVLASVTTVDEALAAEIAGVDGLVVQGSSAGGHSATWDPQRPIVDRPTEQLITDVHAATRLPLIAAGASMVPTRLQRSSRPEPRRSLSAPYCSAPRKRAPYRPTGTRLPPAKARARS